MRDLIILLVHLITTLARLMGPGGARSVIAESLLVKQQLLILNRSRRRAPNLRASDRILAGVWSLFMRRARVIRSAIVLKPTTILDFHRTLRAHKYRLLFSPKHRGRTGPKGPSKELVEAIVEMKQRNPAWGCPRIAQQIGLTFDIQNRQGRGPPCARHTLSAGTRLTSTCPSACAAASTPRTQPRKSLPVAGLSR